jgi:hypothetical protein
MATPIVPRITRGCLWFEVGRVLFPTFAAAASAWSAAEAHRPDIIEEGEL